MRAFRWQQVEAGFLVGLGWTMFFPQGVVAAILLQFDVPPSWFLALHVERRGAAYLVAGAMAGVGLLLSTAACARARGCAAPTVA